eukprot:symbB.v1.2.018505.t1/scaffold1403.1/size153157/11
MILFAISAAEPAKLKKPSLWREFWQRSSGEAQVGNLRIADAFGSFLLKICKAILAFCFAARRPGYGRSAFAEALGGQGHETMEQLVSLADPLLHPILNRCIDLIEKRVADSATLPCLLSKFMVQS